MKQLISTLTILILFAQITFAQTIEKSKKDEISPELKKEAVAFLRETAVDVNTLRTLENRISFSSELANLMWLNDEKEARAMFRAIINDFNQLLSQYNAQALASETAVDTVETESLPALAKSDATRKFAKALNVRLQIATSLAENDAQLAFDFLTDTAQTVTAPAFRKQIDGGDAYFQTRLLTQIAASNVDSALKYGRQTLTKGFNYGHVNLLRRIYEKDPDKGAAFGKDVLAKLKFEGAKSDGIYYLSYLIGLGSVIFEPAKGKTPIFSEQSMHEIADLLAQAILKSSNIGSDEAANYISQIEKFSPAQAEQIRQKYAVKAQSGMAAGIASARGTGSEARLMSRSAPLPPGIPTANGESQQEQQRQMAESVQNLGAKQLSKEERQKVVARARKIINGIKEPNARLFALSALAAQIAAADKELALQIMDDARNVVNLQPKNYQDFLQVLLLAGGYAQVDADKTFPILEDTVFRINDTISAAVKIAEFMDTNSDFIEDGEVQIGSFGGGMTGGITRNLLRGLGASETMLRRLAESDFPRTKTLTNKFDRPEARILAKMLVLRGIFGSGKGAVEE